MLRVSWALQYIKSLRTVSTAVTCSFSLLPVMEGNFAILVIIFAYKVFLWSTLKTISRKNLQYWTRETLKIYLKLWLTLKLGKRCKKLIIFMISIKHDIKQLKLPPKFHFNFISISNLTPPNFYEWRQTNNFGWKRGWTLRPVFTFE